MFFNYLCSLKLKQNNEQSKKHIKRIKFNGKRDT